MLPSAISNRPLRCAIAPVKAPLLVAEELALDECRGQGGAVELDEGPPPPRAQRVEGVGEEVLAHAGLALEEHGRRGRRHLLDLREDVAQRVAAADDALEARLGLHLLAQVGVVGLEPHAQPLDLGKRVAQRLLGMLLVRDVPVRAAQPQEAAVLAGDRRADVVDPPHLAVRADDADLEGRRGLRLGEGEPGVLDPARPVLGGDDLVEEERAGGRSPRPCTP